MLFFFQDGGPNGPTTSTTPTVSSEALQAAIDKYLKDNYDPKVLEMLSRVTNAPSTHSGAAIDNNEGEGYVAVCYIIMDMYINYKVNVFQFLSYTS